MEFTYKCENCGACCRFGNPGRFDPNIVNEHGDCIYLDLKTKLCTIYENRPIFCRLHEWYSITYDPELVPFDVYVILQKIGCDKLREKMKDE